MTLKSYIICQFGELKREMLNVLTGLSQHDLLLKSKVSPHPVGWLVQHCMSVIDWAVVRHITGKQATLFVPKRVVQVSDGRTCQIGCHAHASRAAESLEGTI
jgi:hypothetical protein